MTKNGLEIQTINKRTDNHADRVLLFGQVTGKEEKADSAKRPKSTIFANPLSTSILWYGDK